MGAGRLRYELGAVVVGLLAMLALPVVALFSDEIGPASRVAVRAYLISPRGAALLLVALLCAALISVETYRALTRLRASPRAPYRAWRLTQAAFGLLALMIAWPHLDAFPTAGTAQAREAWARAHVPEYGRLVALVAARPEIVDAVGHVRAVAPTATGHHAVGQEMNGYDMRFALDVVGDAGHGVLELACTIDGDAVLDWQRAHFTHAGRATELSPPALARR